MNTRWLISRLRAMSVNEVAMRLKQAVEQCYLPRYLRNPSRFSLELDDTEQRYPVLPGAFPEQQNAFLEGICLEARDIAAGRWKLLHGVDVEGLTEPDWHHDYLANQSCDRRRAARRLNHRLLPNAMDPRIIWEVNRWQHLVRLAQAAWIEKSEHKANHVVHLLQGWQKSNPVGIGINWTSSLEVGLRLLNLVWLDALIRKITPQSGQWESLLRDLVVPHVCWAWKLRSPGSSANNHLLGEIAGVLVAILRWPGLEEVSVDHETAISLLYSEMGKQFAEDGGNREQALHYHFFAWELCFHALNAIETAGGVIPTRVRLCMQRAAHFWMALEGGDEPWDYGDSDDAIVVPVAGVADPLTNWRAYLDDRTSEISAWVRQPNWMRNFQTANQEDGETTAGWRLFQASGYAVIQNSRFKARFDASPLGYLSGAGHGHLDALHLSIWHRGLAVVIDPGTGGYYANPAERAELTAGEHHNGPYSCEAQYPLRRGPFFWDNHHPAPLLEVLNDGGIQGRLNVGDFHFSRELRVEENDVIRITVCDSAEGHDAKAFQVKWILAPGWAIAGQDAQSIDFRREKYFAKLIIGNQWKSAEIHQPASDVNAGALVSPSFRKFQRSIAVLLKSHPRATSCTSEWIFHEL